METKHTLEAKVLADNILRAAGSGLPHYTIEKTRSAILDAAQKGIEDARAELLEMLESARHMIVNLASSDGDKFTKEALSAIVDKYDAAILKATG